MNRKPRFVIGSIVSDISDLKVLKRIKRDTGRTYTVVATAWKIIKTLVSEGPRFQNKFNKQVLDTF